MSYIRYVRQTRLDTDTAFFSPSAEAIAKMNEYKAAGKIESYNLETISENQLNKEIKITFDRVESYDEFNDEDVILDNKADRTAYCQANYISYSLEDE